MLLKRAYISAAQSILAAPMRVHYLDDKSTLRRTGGEWHRWVASLGAIYHLDRMIALDIPWWNVAATKAVSRFLETRRAPRVFEFGSGASTIWLARRASEVTSVEHDSGWAEGLQRHLSAYTHAHLLIAGYDPASPGHQQPYPQALEGRGLYDLIVIDGRLRNACLASAICALKKDGIILFDDSGRTRYRRAIESSGLSEQHFHGLSYCVPYPDHSSILRTA